ncbi:uncharacterized protein LOC135336803 [Halichondria panicea]|uniref:uncharacterized protein LOC135336803 n=1 Tax=Halichondria panicea TaxID=6063 RepID=UPI00312BA1BA
MTMKIVLVVVVLVACFAAVNCQDALCLSNGLRDNANLQECNTMLATAATNLEAFCQLPCINDLAALFTTCQLPNSITQFCPGGTSAGTNDAASTVAVPMMVLTGLIAALASLF